MAQQTNFCEIEEETEKEVSTPIPSADQERRILPRLVNWFPIAEEFGKVSVFDTFNPLSLFVSNIPAFFSEEEFQGMLEYVTRIKPVQVYLSKETANNYTSGFVNYDTHEDVLKVMLILADKPPFYLRMRFSRRKELVDKEFCQAELGKEMNHSDETSKMFTFDMCTTLQFNSGEQDIVIHSVGEDMTWVFCAPYSEENIKTNLKLRKLLTEHCKYGSSRPYENSKPEEAEMVLALHSDNQWYRATIIEKLEKSYVVLFVDCGIIEVLNLSSLRKMEEQFMKYDIQAHMCSLTGFSFPAENTQNIYEEIKNFITDIYKQPLRALVEVINDDITVTVPKITLLLIEKQLVTISDRQ